MTQALHSRARTTHLIREEIRNSTLSFSRWFINQSLSAAVISNAPQGNRVQEDGLRGSCEFGMTLFPIGICVIRIVADMPGR